MIQKVELNGIDWYPDLKPTSHMCFFSVHLGAFVWLWSMPYKESYGRIRWLLSGIQESRAVELDVTRLAAMISPLIYEAAVMWTGTYLVFFLIMAALCISNLYMVPSLTLLIFITLQTTGRKPQAEILKAWSSRIDYDIYWVTVLRVCPLRLTFCQKYPAYKPTRRPNVLKRLLLSSGKAWKKKHERERERIITASGGGHFQVDGILFNSFPLHLMKKRCDRWHQSIRNGSKWCEVLTGVALDWFQFQRCCSTKMLNFEVNSRLWEFSEIWNQFQRSSYHYRRDFPKEVSLAKKSTAAGISLVLARGNLRNNQLGCLDWHLSFTFIWHDMFKSSCPNT